MEADFGRPNFVHALRVNGSQCEHGNEGTYIHLAFNRRIEDH